MSGRDQICSTSFTADEFAEVEWTAREAGMSVSDYLRCSALLCLAPHPMFWGTTINGEPAARTSGTIVRVLWPS